jgi:16S rRNA (adenine(1408)-N(1))-methyltransferase
VIIDLGTGDGRAALALAHAEPTTLVIGMDADAASMAEVSRRAARKPARGGQLNLLFAVAAAETPPREFLGLADEIRILFPWGSLLRGVLGRDEAVACGIVGLAKPGARVSAVVSVTPADAVDALGSLDDRSIEDVALSVIPAGLRLIDACRVGRDEVRATRSTWGRRLLGSTGDRPVWRLSFVAAQRNTEPDGRPSAEAGV